MDAILVLIGRVLIALLFLGGAVQKIFFPRWRYGVAGRDGLAAMARLARAGL